MKLNKEKERKILLINNGRQKISSIYMKTITEKIR